mgnify:CR=1 FL=1
MSVFGGLQVAKKKEERRVQRELAAAQRIQARMRKSAEKQAAVVRSTSGEREWGVIHVNHVSCVFVS